MKTLFWIICPASITILMFKGHLFLWSWRTVGTYLTFWIAGLTSFPILSILLKKATCRNSKKGEAIYGLDHGRLNLDLPTTMWMNMGYWKVRKPLPVTLFVSLMSIQKAEASDLRHASSALLNEVLKSAGLLNSSDDSLSERRISILDVGFGCGDQTMALKDCLIETRTTYVGITNNQAQHAYAEQRIQKACAVHPESFESYRLFCADAAKPQSWNKRLMSEVLSLTVKKAAVTPDEEVWLLALDTLYHFSPSREPILEFSVSKLKASLMAFDLLLSDSATPTSRLLLSIIARFMGCPAGAFLTEAEYRHMLENVGYKGDVIIRDISEHCFGPLARFLERREKELAAIGLGIGPFRIAKWLFKWWARSRIVRGVIVIAKI
ncbi:hypothetical protein M501DRAFT_997995 [Patellaria atrata CBS 101060]|uniref:Methyltransferase domain-containing protein n=1 Tax=Patellaria atrata CBS 101060 TaxID=1346257 RepID=A0A9P4VTT2_9PEZI|nr:hypothetical protein M501DRAFT_997995 [Patellaria atrata CBS 101060]